MNISEAIEIIKKADFSADTKINKVCNNLRELIARKTNNFANPEKISSDKADMTTIIEKRGYTVAEYKRIIGDVRRSEADVVLAFADRIKGKKSKKAESETAEEKRLRLEAEAAEAELELMKMEFEFLTFKK